MRLALSSAAAPEASLAELASAARRRGLRALELVQGDGHGLLTSAQPEPWRNAAAVLRERQVALAAVVFQDAATAECCAEGAAALGAAVILPGVGAAAFPERIASLRLAGADPVLSFSDPEHLLDAVPLLVEQDCGCAWEVRPGSCDLAAAAAAVSPALGARLRHVRLHGGGPEAVAQEGQGVGSLMRELALAGYTGSLALLPSDARYRVVWSAWLGRHGGWGCGSKSGAHPPLPTRKVEV